MLLHLQHFFFKISRLTALIPRNIGCPPSLKYSIMRSATLSHVFKFLGVRSMPLILFSKTEEWPISSLKSFCIITYLLGIRSTVQRISFLGPVNIFELWHEQNFSPRLFWIYLSSFQIFLDLSENPNRCEPWENIQLELHWFSIHSIQFSEIIVVRVLVGLLDLHCSGLSTFHSPLNDHASFQTQDRIWADIHLCFRPLDCLIMTQSQSHPRREIICHSC